MCRTKALKVVSTEEQGDSETADSFVGVITESESLEIPTISTGTEPWMFTISLNKFPVNFKIDTGADVSVIPEKLYKKLQAPLLEPTKRYQISYKYEDSSLVLLYTTVKQCKM